MRVHEPRGPLATDTVEIQPPSAGWVRITVAACGVCNADIRTAAAVGDSVRFPVTPGHEVAGTIDALGDGVTGWAVGQRVAVGWFGGSCGHCRYCIADDPVHCPDRMIPGHAYPGGWAHHITVPKDALAAIPDGMDLFDAAPMGCAGVTTYNAIRKAHLPQGATVAVFGIGGLGHLAVQFAAKMGYNTIAIARGSDRAELAGRLGAQHYIDTTSRAPAEALAALGGADLILSTASTTEPVTELLDGLAINGTLTLIGVDSGTVAIPAAQLVMRGQSVTGHLTGTPRDIEATMTFAHAHGIRPMIERMPLDQANLAVAKVASGQARFRIVLDTSAP